MVRDQLDSEVNEFNHMLLDVNTENPFSYPEPPPRPPFIIGGEQILQWFKDRFQSSIRGGYNISFIVGEPGAGKSHFLSHLDYLFYETNTLKGIYTVYRARHEEVEERDLWTALLLNDNVLQRLKELIPLNDVQNSRIRLDAKQTILKYLQGNLNIDLLDTTTLHIMGESLSELLVKKNAGICLAIDNIDEYFRFIVEKYRKEVETENLEKHQGILGTLRSITSTFKTEQDKEQVKIRALTKFFGTLRSLTTGLKQIFILLACTTPVYTEIENASTDRTHARRIEFQAQRLKELNVSQAKMLVHKYMMWWAERHGTQLPLIREEGCYFRLPDGTEVSTYPFSETAIEYIHKVTGQFAGDIVCVCNQCIEDMRIKQKVYVVKDDAIFNVLEEARKRRPQLIPRMDVLNAERTRILQKLLENRLETLENQIKMKYLSGIDDETLINVVEKFTDVLGILKESVQPVRDYRDYTRVLSPDAYSKVWIYKDKKIFVKYIFGHCAPVGPQGREFGYDRKIELRDIIEAISQIEDGKVSHALFIKRWADTYSRATLHMTQMWKFSPVIEEFNIDETIYKIIAATEDTSEYKEDLIQYAETNYVNLKAKLDSLVEKAIHEETIEERRRRDKEALTTGVA